LRRSVTPSLFFAVTATSEIFTVSLPAALPIYAASPVQCAPSPQLTAPPGSPTPIPTAHRAAPPSTEVAAPEGTRAPYGVTLKGRDRKSTRLNSSHVKISYAVFCFKKKN